MSYQTTNVIRCDAPQCASQVNINARKSADRYLPFMWLRVRTYDTRSPWEDREYDCCCVACVQATIDEAAEIRYEFDRPENGSADSYEEGEDH